ncbi:MAG: phytanoyl-CoA dioxygenase family protein [Phycisphaerales bacterium]|jgi:ectoine hydroxylase-related dioxygenase (phytanoyl-CoA dioxygenase family)|nr:phytanoyl-CoA dioxygenase family protein [Phycisphaerales bacterium]
MANELTKKQWQFYQENGYVVLGQLLSDHELAQLQQRIDDIMLGKADINYDKLLMQLDAKTGEYADIGAQTRGHKGPTKEYRKIQDLEYDPLFLAYMRRPIFADICRRHYGDTPIACFRAMFMNKPAHKGTYLPWHQDRWNFLDRDPVVTLWTALDPATIGNGCVQVIPGSHKHGLINPDNPSGFLTKEQGAQYCPKEKVAYMEMKPGEVALMNNWLLHSSDINKTDVSRRAFSVCYMDAHTKHTKGSEDYTTIFGPGALTDQDLKRWRQIA